MDQPGGRRRREISRLNGFEAEGWTPWAIVMRPQPTHTYEARDEGREGFYRPNWARGEDMAEAVDQCGIYELKIMDPEGKRSDVVYVGCTCRGAGNNSLEQRIDEYLHHGSHKHEQIDAALLRGYTIHVRVKPCGRDYKNARRALVQAMENILLTIYDYAWNARENGEIRDIFE